METAEVSAIRSYYKSPVRNYKNAINTITSNEKKLTLAISRPFCSHTGKTLNSLNKNKKTEHCEWDFKRPKIKSLINRFR